MTWLSAVLRCITQPHQTGPGRFEASWCHERGKVRLGATDVQSQHLKQHICSLSGGLLQLGAQMQPTTRSRGSPAEDWIQKALPGTAWVRGLL